MTALSALTARTRDYLDSTERDPVNWLAANLDGTSDPVTASFTQPLTGLNLVTVGDLLSIDTETLLAVSRVDHGSVGGIAAPTFTASYTGTAGGTTWLYVVSSVNPFGEHRASPVGVSSARSTLDRNNSVLLQWDAVSGATAYKVYRYNPALPYTDQYALVTTVDGTVATSFAISDYGVDGFGGPGAPSVSVGVIGDLMPDHADTTAPPAFTCARAQQGSAKAAHTAGTLTRARPRFTDYQIFQALTDEIAALSAPGKLWRVKTSDLTWDNIALGYPAPADLDGDRLLEVRWQMLTTGLKEWPEVIDYTISRNMPTGDFPTGVALFVTAKGTAGQPVRVRYRAPFTPPTGVASDATSDCGVPASAVDILPLGAAIRLQSAKPLQRADATSQPDTRIGQEVTTADTLNAASGLRALYTQRLTEERDRLRTQYPTRLIRR